MKRNLSQTSRIALLAAVLLTAACALVALILSLTADTPEPLMTGAQTALKGAENGVTVLLRGATDTDEYFAANYFPTLNGAVGDGVTDDTKAIRDTLKQAGESGGTVYLPQGVYVISEPLTVPSGVSLRGDFTAPNAKQSARTVLFVSDNSSTRKSSLITLEDGASLVGVTVYYEKQDPAKVIQYPVTVSCTGEAKLYRISLLNSYQGISLSGSGRADVRSVWMSPLDYGILIHDKSGSAYVEDVSLSPTYWLNTVPELFAEGDGYQSLTDYLHSHLHGVILQTVSDVTLSRISAEDAAVGVLYDVPEDRDSLLLASELSVTSINLPLQIQSLPKSGVCLTDSVFRPENDAGANTVELGAGVTAPVVFSACTFDGSPKTVIRGENPGFVSFYHCDFGTWWNACFDMASSTFSAVSPVFRTSSDKATLGQNSFGLLYDSPALEDSEELLFSVPEEDAEETYSDTVASLKDTNRTSASAVKIYDARKYGLDTDAQDNSVALTAALLAAEKTGGIVFVPEGTYHMKSALIVPPSVRLMGVGGKGSYRTELTFEVQDPYENHFVALSENASLENLQITQKTEAEGLYYGITSQSKNVRISGVTVRTERGILLSAAEGAVLEHVTLQVSQIGISLQSVQNGTVRDILFHDTSDRSAVGIKAEQSSVSLSGFASETAGQALSVSGQSSVTGTLIRFRDLNTGISSESGSSVILTAVAAESKNGASVFLNGNGGTLKVQGAVFTGTVSEGHVLSASGSAAELRGALITTAQPVSVSSSGKSTVFVVGCVWEVTPVYHAKATGGTVTLDGNLVLSDKEFAGIDASSEYLLIASEGGTVTDGVNVRRFTYVEDVPAEGEDSVTAGE